MKNKPDEQPAVSMSEEAIIDLLQTTPVPLSPDFHGRMAAMPWMVPQKRGEKQMKHTISIHNRKKITMGFALILLLIIVFTAVTPSGRTFAQDMLRFFQRSSDLPTATLPETTPVLLNTDTESWHIAVAEESAVAAETTETDEQTPTHTITSVSVGTGNGSAVITSSDNEQELTIRGDDAGLTAVTSSNGSGGGGGGGGIVHNNVTLAEASDLAGFPVATINALPEGYQLVTIFTPLAEMDLPPRVPGPTFVSLSYQNGADTLLLMQDSKLAVDGNVGETIGETAVIQTVELVPGLLAEYVQGIWVLSDNFEPGSDPMATAVWDNNAPNQQLVWEANGVRYTLKSNSPQLTRSDLIAIAQSIR